MSDLPTPSTFVEVIDRWPSMAELARDLKAETGQDVKQGVVNQWRNRASIQAHWFPAIAAIATRRGYEDISVELLAEIAASLAAAKRAGREAARRADQGAHA